MIEGAVLDPSQTSYLTHPDHVKWYCFLNLEMRLKQYIVSQSLDVQKPWILYLNPAGLEPRYKGDGEGKVPW